MAIPTNKEEWEHLATRALRAFLEDRGAVIRAEAEAHLCELGWVTTNLDQTIPTNRGPQPHHITTARRRLMEEEVLDEQSATLNERRVTAWVNGLAHLSKQETEVHRTAARKRRLYRSYLSWTGNPSLCGQMAERVVEASLETLAGKNVWIPDSASKTGQVREIQGRPVEVGGPLDAAGEWAINPERLADGTVPFAVEVKNIRSWVYPWDSEAWDLLAKLAAFPDVLPILVARRIHPITFRAFKDIGALGVGVGTQWFSESIDQDRFNEVVDEFGFFDAERAPRRPKSSSRVVSLFERVGYTDIEGRTLMEDQLEKWEQASQIALDYPQMRADDLEPNERTAMFEEFSQRVIDGGLYQRGEWAPWHLTV